MAAVNAAQHIAHHGLGGRDAGRVGRQLRVDPEPLQRAEAARAELTALLLDGLGRSKVVEASELTPEEVAAQLRVVMFGAIETIQASVLTTLMLLIQHPESMAQVRADRSLLAGAVDEAIRWMPPVASLREFAFTPSLQYWLGAHLHDYDLIHVHALFSYPSTAAMAHDVAKANPTAMMRLNMLCSPLAG